MSADSVLEHVKEALSGRPGQPLVLGVCQSLADRFDKEAWLVRAITLVLGLFWTFPVLAVYIILGFAMNDTEDRSRRFFSGLCVMAREAAEKVSAGLRDIFGNREEYRDNRY